VASKVRKAVLVERNYEGSRGDEVFLSYETPDRKTILGFLRLLRSCGNFSVFCYAALR